MTREVTAFFGSTSACMAWCNFAFSVTVRNIRDQARERKFRENQSREMNRAFTREATAVFTIQACEDNSQKKKP
jgi:hypothetical protein